MIIYWELLIAPSQKKLEIIISPLIESFEGMGMGSLFVRWANLKAQQATREQPLLNYF